MEPEPGASEPNAEVARISKTPKIARALVVLTSGTQLAEDGNAPKPWGAPLPGCGKAG